MYNGEVVVDFARVSFWIALVPGEIDAVFDAFQAFALDTAGRLGYCFLPRGSGGVGRDNWGRRRNGGYVRGEDGRIQGFALAGRCRIDALEQTSDGPGGALAVSRLKNEGGRSISTVEMKERQSVLSQLKKP